MRRPFLLLLMLYFVGLTLLGCAPEKPALNGLGPLAVVVDRQFAAPATHSPLDWWQIHHFQVVNSGDFKEKDCLYCHKAETSCNNCHGYVGVRRIVEPAR